MIKLEIYDFFKEIVQFNVKPRVVLSYELWDERILTVEVIEESEHNFKNDGCHGMNLSSIDGVFLDSLMRISSALGAFIDDVFTGDHFFIKHRDKMTGETFWLKYSFSGKSLESTEAFTGRIEREVSPHII